LPGNKMTETALRSIVGDFVNQLSAALEAQILSRVQTVVLSALGTPVKRGPGRPPKNALPSLSVSVASARAPRKAGPKQLCPVPGCKNPAAPVFGMVCREHKGLPKAKIKAYREARREAKGNGVAKPAKSSTAQAAPKAAAPAKAGRKLNLTPKAIRARKLQGQYLGALRSLKDDAREKVKKLAQEKGVAEAVKLAHSLAK
jgi:hypothetical protein